MRGKWVSESKGPPGSFPSAKLVALEEESEDEATVVAMVIEGGDEDM